MKDGPFQTDAAIADRLRAMRLVDRIRGAQDAPLHVLSSRPAEPVSPPPRSGAAASTNGGPVSRKASALPDDPDAPLIERFERAMARGGEQFDRFLDRLEAAVHRGSAMRRRSRPVGRWDLIRPATLALAVLVLASLCGIGAWAVLAPRSGAVAVASPDNGRKAVQHAEGGIIREVLVRDGDRVEAGAVLYRLDVVQPQSGYGARRDHWLRLLATRARLQAHATDAERVALTPELTQDVAPELVAFIRTQLELFELARRGLEEREDILRQQLGQLADQAKGRRVENDALTEQMALLQQELRDKQAPVGQKPARRPELLALQQKIAEVRSRIGANAAEIAAIDERAGQARLQINAARTQFRNDNADQLARTNADLAQAAEAMAASQGNLKRTAIVAPTAGTILNQRYKTVGSVVRPGETVVEVVAREGEPAAGNRSTLASFIEPITRSVRHAFRED